jgi:hypothetical protein
VYQVKIPCAILSLFHLLPPAPDKFLVDLVSVTMTLEAQLPGSTALGRQWSPHREVRQSTHSHFEIDMVLFTEDTKD